MSPGRVITFAPFALVLALALVIALAGLLAGPRVVAVPASSASPPPTPRTTSTPVLPSPTATATATPPSPAPTPGSNEPAAMLRVHNELRAAVGAPAVRADDRASAAAQRHAEYLARNAATGHEEMSGNPGFTGVTVSDRLAAQGYTGATASEVAATASRGTDDVLLLWDLPYHRLGLMHPHAVVAGWGHAEISGRQATVGVLIFDFAAPAPERVRSPAAGQSIPRSWDGNESPDALPPGAARPVGYPLMVVYSNAQAVDLRAALLTDAGGREVATVTAPQIYERDYVAIVPASPLAAATRYRVRLDLRVGLNDVVDEWEFVTHP